MRMRKFSWILTTLAIASSGVLAQNMRVDLSGRNLEKIPDSVLRYAADVTELKLGGAGVFYAASVVPMHPAIFSAEYGYNNISELGPEIGRFVNLRSIDLSFNAITTLPEEFYLLSQLEYLQLAFVERFDILGEAPKLARLNNLKTLDILGVKCTRFPGELVGLTNLELLSVGNSGIVIDEEFVKITGQFKRLKELCVMDVGMTSLPGNLNLLETLETLTVSLTPLKDIRLAIGGLRRMKNLKTIRLSAVPLGLDQISELSEALPNVEIDFSSEGAPENK